MKGLILAAGKGIRLRPITFSIPKPLIPIANKPSILYAVEDFIKVGIREIGIVVNGEYLNTFKETIDQHLEENIPIEYIVQPVPKGIANAVMFAKDFIDNEEFLLQLGDNIIIHDYKRFVSGNSKCKILLSPVDDISRYGIVELDGNKIKRLIEKPKHSPSNLAIVGLYLLNKEIFSFIENLKPSQRGEYEITDAINSMLMEKGSIDYDICDNWWKDTGTASDVIEANKFILNNKLKSSYITDSTSILDTCSIGNNVSIGRRCILKNCNIADSIILDNVKLTNIDLKDSIIGADSAITNAGVRLLLHNMFLGNQSTINICTS